ncbi:Gfo/Idh/MocA family protein [Aestuariimicrobium ganziense]|uniref:Gfo/Idh/MocA family protein n=1 Tax=Aestuariimicrobium ganziense TaxID=2773677 RepID=UPI001945AA6C|nr:Gfo/Idh/MocA family oxidoreductase [Aestuariimicrobium ganziense]
MTALPTSRVADPRTAPALRWGFVGTGYAATMLVSDLRARTDQRLVACFSRGREGAEQFAQQWGFERVAGSLEELLAADDIDIVYVATPHNDHHPHALAAIVAGKPVLVEKAFTQTAWQAREIVEAAQQAGVACMEAMWTRFTPRHDIVRQLLDDGALGEIEVVTADHGQWFGDTSHRLHDPQRAGGALLDLGVYPVSFTHFVLGTPGRITARGSLTEAGVDRQVTGIFDDYASTPAQAIVHTTLAAATPVRAAIVGDQARVELDHFFNNGPVVVVPRGGDRVVTDLRGWQAEAGLSFQAAHFAALVAAGATESAVMPHAESIAVMQTLDELRDQVGAVLPGDERAVSRRDLLGL